MVRASVLEIKLTGREVNHSLPTSAKVANEQRYTSTASTCLGGVDRGFSFFSEILLLVHEFELRLSNLRTNQYSTEITRFYYNIKAAAFIILTNCNGIGA